VPVVRQEVGVVGFGMAARRLVLLSEDEAAEFDTAGAGGLPDGAVVEEV
jgi:hypothetical protein